MPSHASPWPVRKGSHSKPNISSDVYSRLQKTRHTPDEGHLCTCVVFRWESIDGLGN